MVETAPTDTDRKALLVRIQRAMESYDPETLGDDPAVFDSWNLLYDLKVALGSSQPVQVEVTDEMRNRAAIAVNALDWGAVHGGVDPSIDDIVDAALSAVLGGGESDDREETYEMTDEEIEEARWLTDVNKGIETDRERDLW